MLKERKEKNHAESCTDYFFLSALLVGVVLVITVVYINAVTLTFEMLSKYNTICHDRKQTITFVNINYKHYHATSGNSKSQ